MIKDAQTIEPGTADPGRPAGYEEASPEEIDTLKALGLDPDAAPAAKTETAPAATETPPATEKTGLPPPSALPATETPPASFLPPPDAKPPEPPAALADDHPIQYEHQGRTLSTTLADAREALRQRHGITKLLKEMEGPREWNEASKVIRDPERRAQFWVEAAALIAKFRDGPAGPGAPTNGTHAVADPRVDRISQWIDQEESRRRTIFEDRQVQADYQARVEIAQQRLDRTVEFARDLGFTLDDAALLALARRCKQIHNIALTERDPVRQRQLLDVAEHPIEVWRYDNREAITAKRVGDARIHEKKTLEQVRKGAAVNPPGAPPVSTKPGLPGRKLEEMSNDEQDRLSQEDFDLLQAEMFRRMAGNP